MSNLPADLTTFVGRRRDIQRVKKLLSSARLVTLVGTGGVGKTRLAVQIADDLRRTLPQGVWMVDLAPVRDPDPRLIASAVAAALGLRIRDHESSVADVAEYLTDWQALLLLDNCEHLIGAVAELADLLLRRCEGLVVLATSRQPLGIPGEFTVTVPPLSAPQSDRPAPPLAALAPYESVRLFLDRAQASAPGFELTEDNRVAVTELVQRLEGIPLLLELAAARIRMLSPRQILERLAGPYRLLTSRNRTGPPRHHSIRALVQWSLDLCDEEKQRLWARLAVFPGDFTPDAAERILSDERTLPTGVPGLLAGLVNNSLVVARPYPGQVRYAVPQALREYAEERLSDAAAMSVLRQRHLGYYSRMADQANHEWFGPRQAEWSRRLRDEHLNLRAALEHALSAGDAPAAVALVEALSITWFAIGSFGEGRRWVRMLLAVESGATPARARALWLRALLDGYAGDAPAALEASLTCRQLAGHLGDDRMLSSAIQHLGVARLLAGDLPAAGEHFEQALALARANDDPPGVVANLFRWGQCQLLTGDPAAARAHLEEADSICGDRGEYWFRSYISWSLALASARLGDPAGAMDFLRVSLRLSQAVGNTIGISQALEVLASVLADDSPPERAAELLGAGTGLRTRLGGSLVPLLAPLHERTSAGLRRRLGEHHYAAAIAKGQAYSAGDAVAVALADRKQPRRSASDAHPALTHREREVADLVAEGLSNKEIAGTLVISRRTVEGHVENLLSKLGFSSRSQIAVWVAGQRAATEDAARD